MQFGLRIEPITSPTPGEYANYYATDAEPYTYIMFLISDHLEPTPLCFFPLLALAGGSNPADPYAAFILNP